MKKDIDFSSISQSVKVLIPKLAKHITFAAVIIILLVFIFTVWRISQLASADPTPEEQSTAEVVSVPKVDQNAIKDVLQLEDRSPQVHALFNQARNNPFGE